MDHVKGCRHGESYQNVQDDVVDDFACPAKVQPLNEEQQGTSKAAHKKPVNVPFTGDKRQTGNVFDGKEQNIAKGSYLVLDTFE
jgi:hypothetical protein